MRIVGHYGPHGPGTAYTDAARLTTYMPGTVPVIWAPEAPTPEAAVVTANGRRGLFAFANSGCPRNPAVLQHLKRRLERIAGLGYRRAVLDELNYPTPHDGELLYSCFCPHCLAHSPLLRAATRLDILRLAEARAQLVEGVLAEVADHAKSLGLTLEAAVHAPTIAQIAGQDYPTFLRHVERLQVMLYHKCPGPACLNRELAMLARLTGQNPYHLDPDKAERDGAPIHVLRREAETARRLGGDRTIPILWADDRLGEAMEAAEAAGYSEAIIFTP